jgi:hypothetical protein
MGILFYLFIYSDPRIHSHLLSSSARGINSPALYEPSRVAVSRPFPSLQYKRAKPRRLQFRRRRRRLPVASGGLFDLGGDGELRFRCPVYIFRLISLDLDRFGACMPTLRCLGGLFCCSFSCGAVAGAAPLEEEGITASFGADLAVSSAPPLSVSSPLWGYGGLCCSFWPRMRWGFYFSPCVVE